MIMKELSIEEKAKRYDEAIEKARQLCAYPTTKPFISDLKDIFPELKESYGEKIRKAIIEGLREMKSSFHTISSINIDDAIGWLEKQGEQKPAEWSEDDDDDAWLNDIISKAECNLQLNEGEIVWLKSLKDRHKSLLKQELDKENKVYLLDFVEWFERRAKAYEITLPMRSFDICALCKEIIERLQTSENLVWNDVNETQRTNTIIMLEEGARRVYTKDSIDKAASWLKSLRPQSQWKPSGEQLHGLDVAITTLRCQHNVVIKSLDSLYNDLKKLREE